MLQSKLTIAFGIVIIVLLTAIGYCGYLIQSTYEKLAKERVKTEECLTSLSDLNEALNKANEAVNKLKIDAKNYKYSKQKLQSELNKIYENFNGATTCQGIVSNIDYTFMIMVNRLKEIEQEIEINEVTSQWMNDYSLMPTYRLSQHVPSNQFPYLKR